MYYLKKGTQARFVAFIAVRLSTCTVDQTSVTTETLRSYRQTHCLSS